VYIYQVETVEGFHQLQTFTEAVLAEVESAVVESPRV
jgi:hypothetical protein